MANGTSKEYQQTGGGGGAGGAVDSVFTRTGAVASANGDYTASQVTNAPSGNISAITVQAALGELDTEKAKLSGGNTFISGSNNFSISGTPVTGGVVSIGANTGGNSTTALYIGGVDNETTQKAIDLYDENGGNMMYIRSDGTSTLGATEMYLNGKLGIGEISPDYKLDINGTLGFTPGASVTPVDNGDVVFEATSNTSFTVKEKGSDATVRSASIPLSSSGGTVALTTDLLTKANLAGGNTFTGDQVFDTNTLFIDSASDMVGVGTIAPVSKFEVFDNSATTNGTGGATIEQNGAGDANLTFLLTGVRRWNMGIDNSDSDKFKIGLNPDLGTSPLLTMDISGNQTIVGDLTMSTAGGSTPNAINIGSSGLIIGQINGNAQVRSGSTGKVFSFKNTASVTKASVDYDTGNIASSGEIIATGNIGGAKVGVGKTNAGNGVIEVGNTAGLQGVQIENDSATNISLSNYVTGDSFVRSTFLANGRLEWGDGSVVADTNLYRSGANVLTTDDKMEALGGIKITNSSTTGHVWTATDTVGNGSWQVAPGGGGGGGSATKGIAEVDFGAIGQESDIAVVTITDASISTTSYPSATMYSLATADHDPDDYMVEGLTAYILNIVNGVSFDISVRAPNLTWGKYKVTYLY